MPMDQLGRSTVAVVALVGVVAICVAVWVYQDVGVTDQALDPLIGPTLMSILRLSLILGPNWGME